MADDDDDEVAIDEGMEPESLTGDAPSSGDDDDDYDDGDDDVAAAAVTQARGGNASLVETPRTVRRISDKTRALMMEAAKKIKASGGVAEDDLEPLDHEELEQEPADHAKTSNELDAYGNPIKPAAPALKAGEQPPPAITPPPVPALDPEVSKLREEFNTRIKELDQREQQLSARELEGDLAQLGEQYLEAGAPAIVSVLKRWIGANATEEELQTEVADLIADLSKHVLGADIPEAIEARIERRRVKRLVSHNKTTQERVTQEAAKKQEIAQAAENRVRVGAVLNQEIAKTENAQAYKFLAVEPEAGLIIYDIVEQQRQKDGTQLSWTEAAKRANDYLEKQSRAWFDKRAHLLATSTAAPSANGQQQRSSQGGQQVRSQAAPQQPPQRAPRPAQPEKPWNAEEHRKQIKAKHRKAFAASDPNE
jgi:hypothetical protein